MTTTTTAPTARQLAYLDSLLGQVLALGGDDAQTVVDGFRSLATTKRLASASIDAVKAIIKARQARVAEEARRAEQIAAWDARAIACAARHGKTLVIDPTDENQAEEILAWNELADDEELFAGQAA